MSLKQSLSLLLCVAVALCAQANKKPLDHSVYDAWESVQGVALSADGGTLTYSIATQGGDSRLVVRRVADGAECVIPQGESPISDGRVVCCLVKTPSGVGKLAIVEVGTMKVVKFEGAESLVSGEDAIPYVAYMSNGVAVVVNTKTFATERIEGATSCLFSRNGKRVAVTLADGGILLYEPATGEKTVLGKGKKFCGSPCFDYSEDRLLFLASDDEGGEERVCSIELWERGVGARTLVAQSYRGEEGCYFSMQSAPFFSQSGHRVFAEMESARKAVRDPKLDIWRWDAILIPPMERAKALKQKPSQVVIDIAKGAPVLLSTSSEDTLLHFGGGDGDYAVLYNDTPYRINSYWETNPFSEWKSDPCCDLYVVNLNDGSRRPLRSKVDGTPRLSPDGKYVLWHSRKDHDWHCLNIAKGTEVNLTANHQYPFYDVENDTPQPHEPWDYYPTWTSGDESLLLCDRYDVWQFNPDGGEPCCLTLGKGREQSVRYRKVWLVDYDTSEAERRLKLSRAVAKDEQMWFTCFSERDKSNGLAVLYGVKPQIPDGFTEPSSFYREWSRLFGRDDRCENIAVSRNGKVMAYTKGDYRNPYDLRLVKDMSRKRGKSLQTRMVSAEKLTSINAMQNDYRWGDAMLVHWKAYDGTPLDGMLFVPEGRKEGEKLPLVIFFYERKSHTLYDYREPAPSQSGLNIPLYVSNGYAVFVPDVVYKVGHPGESAYNCICAGAEAMCEQFPFIDRDRMAIQGHSWGGYQVAHLVTRTNLFKAGESGAPVSNMTSAYGGVRWSSGLVRAMQYERGQSRLGKSLWEEGGLDIYIENSPLFFADKVNTPLLIMTSDTDGSVPWYQSIELFSALRRLSKPVWMLQYHNETHDLSNRENCKDFSVRMMEFFDHYLKDAPRPSWMELQ